MSDTDKTPIAYLTGEYPRATDTFIQREVAALRAQGQPVETCSVRRTGVEHLVGDAQKAEAKATFYILAAAKSPVILLAAVFGALIRNPIRFFRAAILAVRPSNPGTGS